MHRYGTGIDVHCFCVGEEGIYLNVVEIRVVKETLMVRLSIRA